MSTVLVFSVPFFGFQRLGYSHVILILNQDVCLFLCFFILSRLFLPLQFLVDLVICSRSSNYKSLMNFVLRYVVKYSNSVLSLVYFVIKATNN